MTHPLVDQLRFARSELVRSLDSVTEEEGLRRFGPINSIGWIVGHLAYQEQVFWFERRGVPIVVPGLHNLVGFRQPASTPPLDEMWSAWRTVTATSDPFLDTLMIDDLEGHFIINGQAARESAGTMLLRTTHHYWFHNGEAQAIRQLLGHTDLPQFVGNIGKEAPYRRE